MYVHMDEDAVWFHGPESTLACCRSTLGLHVTRRRETQRFDAVVSASWNGTAGKMLKPNGVQTVSSQECAFLPREVGGKTAAV